MRHEAAQVDGAVCQGDGAVAGGRNGIGVEILGLPVVKAPWRLVVSAHLDIGIGSGHRQRRVGCVDSLVGRRRHHGYIEKSGPCVSLIKQFAQRALRLRSVLADTGVLDIGHGHYIARA